MEGKPSAWKLTQIATSDADICRRCTEGKFALLNNLLCLPVYFVDGHAYVSLRDCVANLLGHGNELDVNH